ncbi:YciI family protein [Streptodolium elevatio]|uniref:YciI family protein n=1 Tax=Streptodolium elevatio TaxID=3157996 RepID=A0ABV3DL14_9ACTN
MKFMLMICDDEARCLTPDEIAAHPAHSAWTEEMTRRGVLLSGARLRPSADALSVRAHGGEVVVSDGPFMETKEQIGGFVMIECADADEAVEIAARHPFAGHGVVEVRPVWSEARVERTPGA